MASLAQFQDLAGVLVTTGAQERELKQNLVVSCKTNTIKERSPKSSTWEDHHRPGSGLNYIVNSAQSWLQSEI